MLSLALVSKNSNPGRNRNTAWSFYTPAESKWDLIVVFPGEWGRPKRWA